MQSLLLIPDISGFTKFVNETESEHGRHIVEELLEIIIDSDDLSLTVAEIEGDAILFYLKEEVPSLERVAAVAERMFINFHAHLKQYKSRRICQCGACTSAQALSLKFVAHAGALDFIDVKGFSKPYGPGMILAHRLLKNSIPEDEYLLVTDGWKDEITSGLNEGLPAWARFARGTDRYDEIGEVSFYYSGMKDLHSRIPEPETIEDYERTPNPIARSMFVNLPVSEAFERVMNLDHRLDWTKGVEQMIFQEGRMNRVGTRHQCVIRGDLIDFETVTADFGPNKLVYGERLLDPPIVQNVALFTVLQAEGAGTRIRQEFHYHPKPFPGRLLTPFFRLFARKQLRKSQAEFLEYASALEHKLNISDSAESSRS